MLFTRANSNHFQDNNQDSGANPSPSFLNFIISENRFIVSIFFLIIQRIGTTKKALYVFYGWLSIKKKPSDFYFRVTKWIRLISYVSIENLITEVHFTRMNESLMNFF